MNKIPEGVVFDLDGTLLDTETTARELFIAACREIGCRCEIEVYEETVGLNVRQAHEVFFERLGREFPYPELRKLSSRWFAERLDQGPFDLKQGAIELLVLIKTLEIPVGLCTSTGRKTVEKSLAHLKLEKSFKEMVCGGESEKGKPHPDPYRNIANKLGIDPKKSWAIEDSKNGVQSAYQAGFKVLHVPEHKFPISAGIEYQVSRFNSLVEIANLLDRLSL